MGRVDHVNLNVLAATILALAALALAPRNARADGGIIVDYRWDISEPAQRAILLFDPAVGREELILQAEYEGNTDNLAWIVPVPSLPTLAIADAQLFVDCARLTRIVARNRGLGCGESGKIWFFVAMRTDSASVAGRNPGDYRVGGLDPIRLTFSTTKAIYPLRISAISARDPSQVLLYVCAPHRMTFPGAHAEYANRINQRELRHLQSLYPLLGSVITQPCFLTKLRNYVPVSAMNDDLILQTAPDDSEFRDVWYAGIPLAEMLFVALVLAIYGGSRRLARRRRVP